MWTSYDALTGRVLAADWAEMRLALDEARVQLQLKPATYSTAPPLPGQPIRRVDVEDLRKGVQ